MKASLTALALICAASGCASPHSCPGVYLSPVVHVDATAWVDDKSIDRPTLKATVCVDTRCGTATVTGNGDLLRALTLPKDKATVRVQLTLSTGRTLDQTTAAPVTLTKPFGSGCGGREEIDLTVTKAGALVPGQPAKVS